MQFAYFISKFLLNSSIVKSNKIIGNRKNVITVLKTSSYFPFFKASRAQARLLVITSVSDLVVHLVSFCLSPFFHVCQVVTFTKRIKMAVLF